MEITTQETARILGSKLLNVAEDSLTATSLDNNAGFYVYESARGGGSLMIAHDGSVLFANSSVSYDEHLQAFLSAQRTDASLFQQ